MVFEMFEKIMCASPVLLSFFTPYNFDNGHACALGLRQMWRRHGFRAVTFDILVSDDHDILSELGFKHLLCLVLRRDGHHWHPHALTGTTLTIFKILHDNHDITIYYNCCRYGLMWHVMMLWLACVIDALFPVCSNFGGWAGCFPMPSSSWVHHVLCSSTSAAPSISVRRAMCGAIFRLGQWGWQTKLCEMLLLERNDMRWMPG